MNKFSLSLSLLQELPLLSVLKDIDPNVNWGTRIDNGEVRVFGKIVGKKYLLKKRDLLQWSACAKEPEVRKDFSVIYQDDFIVAINKQAPLPVHPCGAYLKNTLTTLLKEGGYNLYGVNRIDKETSGLIFFVRDPKYGKALAASLAEGVKFYWVLVHGRTNDFFKCDLPLGKKYNSFVEKKMGYNHKGKEAKTLFQKVHYFSQSDCSLLLARPLTGRTHQIRAHLRELGHAVFGDKIYGKDEKHFLLYLKEGNSEEVVKKCDGLTRQFLHAGYVRFMHPWHKKEIVITCPMSDDLKDYLKKLN